mmetsp:Transcript_15145/g.49679  ORF Transcript_15145/g.49679 Transcript_15145/m.49679 type:complete len:228 (+) Transcript_15145:321-1004(+)
MLRRRDGADRGPQERGRGTDERFVVRLLSLFAYMAGGGGPLRALLASKSSASAALALSTARAPTGGSIPLSSLTFFELSTRRCTERLGTLDYVRSVTALEAGGAGARRVRLRPDLRHPKGETGVRRSPRLLSRRTAGAPSRRTDLPRDPWRSTASRARRRALARAKPAGGCMDRVASARPSSARCRGETSVSRSRTVIILPNGGSSLGGMDPSCILSGGHAETERRR